MPTWKVKHIWECAKTRGSPAVLQKPFLRSPYCQLLARLRPLPVGSPQGQDRRFALLKQGKHPPLPALLDCAKRCNESNNLCFSRMVVGGWLPFDTKGSLLCQSSPHVLLGDFHGAQPEVTQPTRSVCVGRLSEWKPGAGQRGQSDCFQT